MAAARLPLFLVLVGFVLALGDRLRGKRGKPADTCPPASIDPRAFTNNSARFNTEADAFGSYMHGPCMARRRTVAAAVLLEHKCLRIAEVGGLLLRVVDDVEIPLSPELYINIDPTAPYKVAKKAAQGQCMIDLPLTTQQYASSTASALEFDCVVVLGAMPSHFADGAMLPMFRSARLVVIDEAMTVDEHSPCGNCKSIRSTHRLLSKLGFALHPDPAANRAAGVDGTSSKSKDANGTWELGVSPLCQDVLSSGLLLDCRGEAANSKITAADSNLLGRQLVVYSRT